MSGWMTRVGLASRTRLSSAAKAPDCSIVNKRNAVHVRLLSRWWYIPYVLNICAFDVLKKRWKINSTPTQSKNV
ncbi:hypothetical protein LXL04_015382 [Taraxacum kok-saghyz]